MRGKDLEPIIEQAHRAGIAARTTANTLGLLAKRLEVGAPEPCEVHKAAIAYRDACVAVHAYQMHLKVSERAKVKPGSKDAQELKARLTAQAKARVHLFNLLEEP